MQHRRLAVLVAVVGLGLLSASAVRTQTAEHASVSFVRGASVYVVPGDGGRVSRVLRTNSTPDAFIYYYDPAWSQDGLLAVAAYFEPTEGNAYSEIQIFGLPSSPLEVASGHYVEAPSWAPDGRLVFVYDANANNCADCGGPLEVWRRGAKRSSLLTPESSQDNFPAWSPDGASIVFARTSRDRSRQQLYLIRLGHSGATPLTTTSGRNPSWSPDSRRIVFDDGRRVAVVGVDGKGMRYLTSPATHDSDPAWSPDGQWIAFVRRRPGARVGDIWLMHPSGGAQRLLVRNAYQPAWRP